MGHPEPFARHSEWNEESQGRLRARFDLRSEARRISKKILRAPCRQAGVLRMT